MSESQKDSNSSRSDGSFKDGSRGRASEASMRMYDKKSNGKLDRMVSLSEIKDRSLASHKNIDFNIG